PGVVLQPTIHPCADIEVSGGDRLFFNLSPHLSPITVKAVFLSYTVSVNRDKADKFLKQVGILCFSPLYSLSLPLI
ncbi:hypothetical protein, partial [Bacteroides congonensis]|uniref:hypothetical protein n=1 Tax=Bacteroides congonensis TaxID=1871006 RepID=UPI00321B4100